MLKPRKVLTAAQMSAVDRATIDAGIPSIILMENAAHACVEYIAEKFSPVSRQRIVVVCGKGNNGGDGIAIARQLHVRFEPAEMWVVIAGAPPDLTMLHACGLQEYLDFAPEMRSATLVIDAVLGTGLRGPATGDALNAIGHINRSFPYAKVLAVDIPSGLSGDTGAIPGEYVHADATVTFTAPKVCHAMAPAANLMGDLRIAPIGSPRALYEDDEKIKLALIAPPIVAPLFAPRVRDSNKGKYGHVLLIAGSRGKSGAAAMSGLAALRAGAGLVTVGCPDAVLDSVAAHAPELMVDRLPDVLPVPGHFSVVGMGPGIGTSDATRAMVLELFQNLKKPMVVDADALNCIAGQPWGHAAGFRVLTPHPGEMSRLMGRTIAEIQSDRIDAARSLATDRGVVIVLKGERTLIAFPDGRVWINPTGSPAMATGGTGDILTGMIAALLAQFPAMPDFAIAAAVYLHGLAGEIAARHLEEQPVIATDLLRFLPEGIRAITNVPDPL
ncbi:MAG: NAD(P)H-hydrate dehydratase [Terriglobia bacterium]